MEESAVSRPTLREAFRVLESESMISIRRGARGGARVQVLSGNVAASYAGLALEPRPYAQEGLPVDFGLTRRGERAGPSRCGASPR